MRSCCSTSMMTLACLGYTLQTGSHSMTGFLLYLTKLCSTLGQYLMRVNTSSYPSPIFLLFTTYSILLRFILTLLVASLVTTSNTNSVVYPL